MEISYSVAVDVGASNGRVIIGQLKNKKIELNEVYRFENGFIKENEHYYWDIENIINKIVDGLKKAKQEILKKCSNPYITVGIDTWGVDYVLLDQNEKMINKPFSYRDSRTEKVIEKVHKDTPDEKIFQLTGIGTYVYNSLYQLFAEDKKSIQKAKSVLLIPDYINYRLTGKKCLEITNGSTMQLLNVGDRAFNEELLNVLKMTEEQFPKIIEPPNMLGNINNSDLSDVKVVNVASHDTASAIAGVPVKKENENWAFISSGTWSILGAELKKPVLLNQAQQESWSNERGANNTYTFVKNIMGMWLIQSIKKELNNKYSNKDFDDMVKNVKKPYEKIININDNRFMNPKSMINELKSAFDDDFNSISDLLNAVYTNLALYYSSEIRKLQQFINKKIDTLHIIGGGSNVEYLNQLTADFADVKVITGPTEATVLGNVALQMISKSEIENVQFARNIIGNSFDNKTFVKEHDYSDLVEKYAKEFK